MFDPLKLNGFHTTYSSTRTTKDGMYQRLKVQCNSIKQINHCIYSYLFGNTPTDSNPPATVPIMIPMRDTIASPDQERFDNFMDQHRDGNTMTSFDLIDGTIQIRIVRSKTLEILAEDAFADSGLATTFITELTDAAKELQKSRANVTERGIHGTPEPDTEAVF